MSGILAGKRILVTGVLTESSIAFHAAKVAQERGRRGHPHRLRPRSRLVERIAKRLPKPAPVIELDVTNQEHLDRLADKIREHELDGLDGIVHSIAFGPQGAFNFLEASWEDVGTAVHVSAYSLQVAHHGLPAADAARRLGRRPHLRRADRLAEVRLDGRGQGGAGGDQPLPRA